MNLKDANGKVPVRTGDPVSPYKLIDFPSRAELDGLFGKRMREEAVDRMYSMMQMRANGATLMELGSTFNLNRERVRQIEAKFIRALTHHYQHSKASSSKTAKI